ncbi:TPA: hypothetical protein QDB15_000696 [Burkholderia vietnamiensis]|uniref:hypothetical protein n=1 Tax=Burkholderia cepacia complex TaxID=87882 RepID=UPI0015936839|nr:MULTISPECIES: hypothetical protein [Burkholderia cepacia complex]MCA8156204.1 hypothetical protein [Burkholderia contaminans]MCA8207954.1 hypothetical protein [Burkholderia vietnamiensis]HDR9103049.1 hypothetical protein [Burkholderia vietnamiensis]HDR9116964.1 hypothetical protein [Burkholderia vietnamiensis]HDR9166273.1 hypothetical protein [Burkholderia vietnamiensis]
MQHISLQFSQSRYSALALARQTVDAAWRALMDSMGCIVRIWTIHPSLAGGVMA